MNLSESDSSAPIKKQFKEIFTPLFKKKDQLKEQIVGPKQLAKTVSSLYKQTEIEQAKKLTNSFFLKATPHQQKVFFKAIADENLFTQILLDLPRDLTQLNLALSKYLSDSSLVTLAARLPKQIGRAHV